METAVVCQFYLQRFGCVEISLSLVNIDLMRFVILEDEGIIAGLIVSFSHEHRT